MTECRKMDGILVGILRNLGIVNCKIVDKKKGSYAVPIKRSGEAKLKGYDGDGVFRAK